MDRIDNLDRVILNLLMNNARIPSKDVADACGVSRAAIHQRMAKLIDTGVITGSSYQVDPSKLGYHTTTFIGVSLRKGSLYHEVVKELEKIPEVVECHYTTGPYSMFIKVYAKDNNHLMTLLNSCIQNIEGVIATETLICLERSLCRHISVAMDENETAHKEALAAAKKTLASKSKEKKRPGRKKGSTNKRSIIRKTE